MRNLISIVFVLVSFSVSFAQIPDKLSKSTVLVRTDSASGSGVVFNNGDYSFVWTAGHVVSDSQVVTKKVDPKTGQPFISIKYKDVMVAQEEYENGRKIGETYYLAEILRYSQPSNGGHDLALLLVHKKKAFPNSVSFWPVTTTHPKEGAGIWHVGSMSGREGTNSVADGVFAKGGRLRNNFNESELEDPVIYDQVTVPALAGSSGGPVFTKCKDNYCIGLLVAGLSGGAEAINLIVPTRRIREYAEETKCNWAIDEKTKAPVDKKEMRKVPVTHIPIPLPSEKPPAAGTITIIPHSVSR